MDISNRQIKLLQFIIDEYTLTAQPVSSKVIVDKYFFNLSPQTIRNEMLYLEKIGLLEKTHTSSGRIPSLNGYKFYEMNILKPYLSNDVKNQLKVIFQKRDLSIDMIINESASLIEEILKLPTVVASQDSNVLLKRFDLIPITDQKVLLLLVTSNGDVIKNDISITNNKELDDVIGTSQVVIIYDELFQELMRGDKLSKDVLDFLSQMRKRQIIFLTSAQYWSEIPITFRKFVRYQIDCNFLNFPFLPFSLLVKTFRDGENMKWSNDDQEFIAPIIETTITKVRKSVFNSYDTMYRVSSHQVRLLDEEEEKQNDNSDLLTTTIANQWSMVKEDNDLEFWSDLRENDYEKWEVIILGFTSLWRKWKFIF